MAAEIVPLRNPLRWSKDWSQQEIAEFYRVESALVQAGLGLFTARGVSDEGDPWFVFCRSDTEEVFLHFARIDGQYVVDGGPLQQVAWSSNFAALVRDMLGKQPLEQARTRGSSNIFLHPAALLIALVGGAFFHSGEAKAAEAHSGHAHADFRRQVMLALIDGGASETGAVLEATQTAAILTSVMIGLDRQALFAPAPSEFIHTAMVSAPIVEVIQWLPETLSAVIKGAPSGQIAAAAAAQGLYGAALPDHTFGLLHSTGDGALATMAPHLDFIAMSAPATLWQTPLPSPAFDQSAVIYTASSPPPPLPNGLAAAMVVQSAESLANVSPVVIVQLAALPSTLTDLIDHGKQAAPLDVGPTLSTSGLTPPLNPPVAPTAPADPAAPPPAPSLADASPPPAAQPETPGALNPHDPAISAAVASFIGIIQAPDMIVSGHEIVIYDGAILNALPQGTALDSLTFSFTDGSSLSLVGTAAEIHALHWGG